LKHGGYPPDDFSTDLFLSGSASGIQLNHVIRRLNNTGVALKCCAVQDKRSSIAGLPRVWSSGGWCAMPEMPEIAQNWIICLRSSPLGCREGYAPVFGALPIPV